MKKVISICFLLVLLCSLVVWAYPSPTYEFYAADFVDALSTDTEQYITSHSKALYDKTEAQIVVAALENIEGHSIREYGLELARQWKIGSEKDNGVLILLAMKEREISVEVGYGLEGALNDAKVGRLIDSYAMEPFSKGDFNSGLKALYTAVLTEVYKEYGMEVPDSVDYIPPAKESEETDIASTIIVIVIFIIVIIINTKGGGRGMIFFPGGRGGGFGGGFGGGSGGGFGGGGSFGGGGASRKF